MVCWHAVLPAVLNSRIQRGCPRLIPSSICSHCPTASLSLDRFDTSVSRSSPLHAFPLGALRSARQQVSILVFRSGHCLFEEVSWNSKISFLPISVIKSFDSSLKWLISSDFSKPVNNIFLFLAIRFHLFNSGVWNAWDSKIFTTTATGPPVLMNFVLAIFGFSRIRDKCILLSVLRVRHECYAR